MLKKVTLKKIKKNEVLYLQKDEAVVIVTGNLHMISYENDIMVPNVVSKFTAGDIIGLPEIDNGWSRTEHCWIVAWEECDLFYISADYLRYMWDQMKQLKSTLVQQLLTRTPIMREVSEQT
jgi:CRP-like cAMP-binding protein